MAMLEEQQAVTEVQGVTPPGGKSPMGQISHRQCPETTSSLMSFASAVPLPICCCSLSLVSRCFLLFVLYSLHLFT